MLSRSYRNLRTYPITFRLVHHHHTRSLSASTKQHADPWHTLYDLDGYKNLIELQKWRQFLSRLSDPHPNHLKPRTPTPTPPHFNTHPTNTTSTLSSLSKSELLLIFDAAIPTHCTHIQSR